LKYLNLDDDNKRLYNHDQNPDTKAMQEIELKELIAKVKAQQLTELDLSDQQITEIPKEIGDLISLQYLGLNNNQIAKLPESIGNLSSLLHLDINKNQIVEIPESISNLTCLQSLNLYSNQITTTTID
jgi:internalin A